MKYTLKGFCLHELGQRKNQEDSIFPKEGELNVNDRLFILCDGMGGHEAGEVASQTVCDAMSKSVLGACPDAEGNFSDQNFLDALEGAFDALDDKRAGKQSEEKKMGTTMTFLKLHQLGATIAHIGDSRVYHIRPGKDKKSTQILFQTEDHSLVNDLVRIGEITKEEARHSNQKNVITRAMQPDMERRPKADIYHTDDLLPGDYFMLCSDGILEQMEEENIKYIFSDAAGGAEQKVEMLKKVTLENNDNHSAIIVHLLNVQNHRKEVIEEAEVSIPSAVSKSSISLDKKEEVELPHVFIEKEDNPPSKRAMMKYLLLFIVFAIICFAGYWFFKTRG